MKYKVLKTHLNRDQKVVRRGAEIDLSEKDADDKIRRGLVQAPADGGGRGGFLKRKSKSAPKKAAAKKAPENKSNGNSVES